MSAFNLDLLAAARLAVVGDYALDVWHEAEYRPNPEALPHRRAWSCVRVSRIWQTPGMAGAVAAMARALGAKVECYTPPKHSRKHRFLASPEIGRPPEVCFRYDEDAPPLEPNRAAALGLFVASEAPAFGAVLIADYGKGCCQRECLAPILQSANEAGVPVLVDPALSDCRAADAWERYLGASVVKCNAAEWEGVGDRGRAKWVQETFPAIVVTEGSRGMRLWDRETGRWTRFAAEANQDPLDVCGAGDCVLAVLGACLAVGVALADACPVANAAAAVKVRKRGAVPVTPAEILAELQRETNGQKNLLPVRQ